MLVAEFDVGGGPATIRATVTGTLADPVVTAGATWANPRVAGRSLEDLRVSAEGGSSELQWDAKLTVFGATRLGHKGCSRQRKKRQGGE